MHDEKTTGGLTSKKGVSCQYKLFLIISCFKKWYFFPYSAFAFRFVNISSLFAISFRHIFSDLTSFQLRSLFISSIILVSNAIAFEKRVALLISSSSNNLVLRNFVYSFKNLILYLKMENIFNRSSSSSPNLVQAMYLALILPWKIVAVWLDPYSMLPSLFLVVSTSELDNIFYMTSTLIRSNVSYFPNIYTILVFLLFRATHLLINTSGLPISWLILLPSFTKY